MKPPLRQWHESKMFNFGTTDAHNNAMTYGDIAALDAMSLYSFAFWIIVNTQPASNPWCFGKHDSSVGGWIAGITNPTVPQLRHRSASGGAFNTVNASSSIGTGSIHSIVITWDGATARFYIDGVLDASPALTRTLTANSIAVAIGNLSNTNNSGVACSMGQVMAWDMVLTQGDVNSYHAGVQPQAASLIFWVKCTADPGVDEVSKNTGTKIGTVTLLANNVDSLYLGGSVENTILETVRQRLSRRLRLDHLAQPKHTIRGGLELLELLMLKEFHISHPFGAEETGTDGWSRTVWQRRVARPLRKSIDFANGVITVRSRDLRDHLARFWIRSIAITLPSPARLEGIPELTTGNSQRMVTRNTRAYVLGDANIVKRINEDELKTEAEGVVMEGKTINYIPDPAFADPGGPFSHWSAITEGGGTVAQDTTMPFFEESVSPGSVKITGGDPPGTIGTGLEQLGQLISSAAGRYSFSFDFAQGGNGRVAPAPLSIKIRDDITGDFLDFSTKTWGATLVWNLVQSTKIREFERFVLPSIDWTPSSLILFVQIVQRTTGNNVHWIGHVQWEKQPIVSSRWLQISYTDETLPTEFRGEDDWFYPDLPEQRQFHEEQGSLKIVFRPLYTAADLTYLTDSEANYLYLWEWFVSTTKSYRIYYNPASAKQNWNFEQNDGTPVAATLTAPLPVRGSRIILMARWTGAQNELDVTSKEIQLAHVDDTGVLTVATASVSLIGDPDADNAEFRIGQNNGGDFNAAWAQIEEVEVSPFVKTDLELIAWAV